MCACLHIYECVFIGFLCMCVWVWVGQWVCVCLCEQLSLTCAISKHEESDQVFNKQRQGRFTVH